jgi:phosphoglycolate phosphatase
MQTRLVIFDLDGTLIDSLGDIGDAMNAVLSDLGHPVHPRDSYRFLVGDGLEILVRRALPPEIIAETNIEEVVSLTRQEYSTRWTATTLPFPEVVELLGGLKARGIQTAVLSNKPDFATRAIVGDLFADHAFDVVRGARDDVPLKPDPTAFATIISDLGISAKQTVFVGDTAVDMETGVNAGALTVGVTWGFREADELVAHGADHIINSPLEILEILGDAEQGHTID